MDRVFYSVNDIDRKSKVPFSPDMMPKAFLSENRMSRKLRNKLVSKRLTEEADVDGNRLSEIFYCEENINLINKQIVLEVYKKSKLKVPFQSKIDLMVVMRWVYITYAKNLPFEIKKQIRELNNIVVKHIVPDLISETEHHLGYLEDISKPRELIPLPVNVSRDRSLPSISEIYHGN
mgnify:CR=1 FL=1